MLEARKATLIAKGLIEKKADSFILPLLTFYIFQLLNTKKTVEMKTFCNKSETLLFSYTKDIASQQKIFNLVTDSVLFLSVLLLDYMFFASEMVPF